MKLIELISGGRMKKALYRRSISAAWLCLSAGLSISLILLMPVSSSAHGFAGKRFFPTTFQVDDPFISDEFSILINRIKQSGDEPTKLTLIDIDYSKRILPNFGLEFHEAYLHLGSNRDVSANGWDNLGVEQNCSSSQTRSMKRFFQSARISMLVAQAHTSCRNPFRPLPQPSSSERA